MCTHTCRSCLDVWIPRNNCAWSAIILVIGKDYFDQLLLPLLLLLLLCDEEEFTLVNLHGGKCL